MYSIIYGRLVGKHFVDAGFEFNGKQKVNFNYINADFISEYKIMVSEDEGMEGFHTSSVSFSESLVAYDHLIMEQMYFLLADDDNHVLYFEKLNGEQEEIYVKVGEELLDLPPAPTL